MFGAPAPAAPAFSFAPQPAAPSLFGAPAAAPTTGLFGSLPKPAPAPLFPTQNKFNFGAAPATTPSLFGAPAPSTVGLFGAPAPTTGLFGSTAPTTTSLFGQPPANNFNSGQAPAAAAPISNVTKHTKFNDAPENYKTLLESIDGFIKSQIVLAEDLKTKELGVEIDKTDESYTIAAADFRTLQNQLSYDSRLTAELRGGLERSLSDMEKTTSLIEGFKTPGKGIGSAKGFGFEYFSRRAIEFNERIEQYQTIMEQIYQQVNSNAELQRNPSAILPTLKAQHSSFMYLASAVASLDSDLKSLREDYRAIWKEKTGSSRDPFAVARLKANGEALESGVEGIKIQ